MSYTIGMLGPVSIAAFREHINGPAGVAKLPAGLGGSPVDLLCIELLRRGHRLIIFTLDPYVSGERVLEGECVKICIGPYRPRHRARDFFANERKYLVGAVERESVDVLHAHWTYEYALAALENDIPHVITAHDAPVNVLRLNPIPYRFMRLLMAYTCLWKARKVAAVSPYVAEHCHRYRFYRRNIEVVPNGMLDHLFEQRSLGKERAKDVVFATVLNGWGGRKNGQVAIEALAMLRRAHPTCRMIMFGVGHGTGEEAERWACSENLSEAIEFRGEVPYADLMEALSSDVDILVHPSLEESHGMALIEAMGLGIPVIAGKDSGAVPWTLDEGKAGVLVDVRSPKCVLKAMRELVENENKRLKCGEAGREFVSTRFRIGIVADAYERIYEGLLSTS